MKKVFMSIINWFKNHLPSERRLIQLYAALLYNANIKGFITGSIFKGNTKIACVPGLNCYSCPGAVGACPLGSLQNALASTKQKAPYYVIGIIMLYGLMLGRTICGFLCPMGLLQELLHKIPTPKINKSTITRVLSYFKYVLLFVLVIVFPIMYSVNNLPLPGFCKYICPAGIVEGAFGLIIHPTNTNTMLSILDIIFSWKFCLLVFFIVMCIFMYRFFCRFICPLGALYGFFNRLSFIGVTVNQDTCTNCGLCIKACKMDVHKVGDHECINCGECISSCPTKAISFKGSQIFLHKNQIDVPVNKETISLDTINESNKIPENKNEDFEKVVAKRKKIFKITSWSVAGAVLVGALVYFNFIYDDNNTSHSEIGDTCEKFYVSSYLDNEIIQIGKYQDSRIILYFYDSLNENDFTNLETLQEKYTDLEIITIHSYQGHEDVRSYINTNYSDSKLIFTYDDENNSAFNSFKSLTYPSTVLLGKNNIINFKENGSFNEEKFDSILSTGKNIGNKIGDILPNYELPYYNKEGNFAINNNRGKITIMNFWATWCGPCVEELPEFDEIAKEFINEVEVVAIHSIYIDKDVASFIQEQNGWSNFTLSFAQDDQNNPYYDRVIDGLGVNGIPNTFIIDQDGVITHFYPEKVSYATLKSNIEEILQK